MAQVTEEQFQDKLAEVVGQLGVGIASIVDQSTRPDLVREEWKKLGRGLGELMEMQPPG